MISASATPPELPPPRSDVTVLRQAALLVQWRSKFIRPAPLTEGFSPSRGRARSVRWASAGGTPVLARSLSLTIAVLAPFTMLGACADSPDGGGLGDDGGGAGPSSGSGSSSGSSSGGASGSSSGTASGSSSGTASGSSSGSP